MKSTISKIDTISQSMLKSYMEYLYGEQCGELFNRQYVTKDIDVPPSDAMLLGRYFEYKCTGYKNPDEPTPEPKLTRAGEPTAPYKRANEHAERFHEICIEHGIKIKTVGRKIKRDGLTCVIDVEAEYNGEDIIIDLKYSGRVNDKWDKHGWHLDSFDQKFLQHIQPMHYAFMTGKRFFYFVFSSKNDDVLLFEVNMPQPETNEIWEQRLKHIREKMNDELLTGGFTPRPSYERCNKCPILNECQHANITPRINEVYITPTYDKALDE